MRQVCGGVNPYPHTEAITISEGHDGCIHPKLDFGEMGGNTVAKGCLEQRPRGLAGMQIWL